MTGHPGPGALGTMPPWLARAADRGAVAAALARHVPDLAAGRLRLVAFRPDGLRARTGRWSARYVVTVEGPGGGRRDVTLAGELRPPGAAGPAVAADGWRGPLGWRGALPELGLVLAEEHGDRRLPALALLTDPGAARTLLEAAIGAGAHPGIRIAGCTAEVRRHKPGNRCTLVHDLYYGKGADSAWPRRVVAKVHRGDEGAATHAAMRALWSTDLASGRVVAVAEPLGYLPAERVLVQRAVPGEATLADLVRGAGAGPPVPAHLPAVVRAAADGLAAVHRCGASGGRVTDWASELRGLRSRADRLSAAVPHVGEALAPLLADLDARAAAVPAQPPVPSHGAFRPAQVLVAGDRVAFVDFDGFARSEPALDVGRFCARLRELVVAAPGPGLTGPRIEAADALAGEFVRRYAGQAPLSLDRVALWQRLDLVAAVVQSWTRVQPSRLPPVLALLDATASP